MKQIPKSGTAGAVLEKLERGSADRTGDDRFTIILHGVVRIFDKHHVLNDNGTMSLCLTTGQVEHMIIELTNALKSGNRIQ